MTRLSALLPMLLLAAPSAAFPTAPTAPLAAPLQGGGGGEGQVPTIQEAGDFYILNLDETGDGIDLEQLTKWCQIATGKNFTYDDGTSQTLASQKVRLFGTKRIPKEEFYSFYQILMFINGFILTKVGPDHLAVVLVQPVTPQGGGGGRNLRNEAVYLLPDELDQYADQVATQVITVMHLPHTDVRTLGNSLRSLSNDASGTQGVIPVGNTQSVILQGFASNVASLARILRLVDEESARNTDVVPEFEVIPVEFAAAEDLADILEKLLEASRRQQQQTRAQDAQGATGRLQSSGGETKILTDPRTNSLLVMALPEDMKAIKELIARLDVDVPEPERTYHVYVLQNVRSDDLATTLEDFVEGANRVAGAGRSNRGGGGGGAAAAVAPGGTSRDNEIAVVSDASTNSLLIAASKRRYEEITELIQQLDRRQDQVLIETALIELSGRDSLDIGVELGLADIPTSGDGGFGVTNFGLGQFFDSNNDGIPDVKIPNAALGVTAGIISGDDFSLPFLVAALKDRNDTNVLNIPSVLVNNNGSATVTSVDSQPTTDLTQATTGGTQETFSGYEDAGITMQISPSISAAGYLRLDVQLEISTFTGTFAGAVPPPKITRTIQTSVSVPDGDTMVIGGIITDNKDKGRSMIPFLGDLPLVGALFRRDTTNANRTTLYFFVTPHILRDENFADLREITRRVKLEAADKIGADRLRMIDHDFGKSEEEVNLDGFDVPLYNSPATGEVDPETVGWDPQRRAKAFEQAETVPAGTATNPE